LSEAVAQALRLGVFGGAFDPPHTAHRQLVEAALRQSELDRMILLPTGSAWHKARPLTAAHHRLAMLRLAFGGMPRVAIDPRETEREGPSYTAETLVQMQAEQAAAGRGAAWFLYIGQDQAESFHRWKTPERIAKIATIIVAARGQPVGLNPEFLLNPQDGLIQVAFGAFGLLQLPPTDTSSSQIRAAAASKQLPDLVKQGLVEAAVARYIEEHQLYRDPA
jgi:nicotinate-nucleotide adenylyltransferase